MVVRSGRWDMISGFFGEDQGIVGELWGKGLFGFCPFGGSSEFSGSGDFRYISSLPGGNLGKESGICIE